MSKRENKRIGNITSEQKCIMLEFLEGHPELISSKFTSTFTFKTAQILWQDLAEVLNAVPGARKDWSQWRKTWHDMRTSTKSKSASILRNASKTGGGPPSTETLSQSEAHCARLIGSTTIHGDPTIEESSVTFSFDNLENEADFRDVQLRRATDADAQISASNSTLSQSHIDNSSVLQELTHQYNSPQGRIDAPTKRQAPNTPCFTHESKRRVSNVSDSTFLASPITRQRTVSGRRLEGTLKFTNAMMESSAAEIELRKNYYKHKLELMKRDVAAKEQIAKAVSIFCNLQNNDENDMIEEYLDPDFL